MAKDPRAPQGNDLEEWRSYLEKKMDRPISSEIISPEEINQLKAKLLKERTGREAVERKLKEMRLEREKEGFIPFVEAQEIITRILEPLSRILEGIPKKYALRVNPSDPDHGEEMLREMVREVKSQVQDTRGTKITKRKGVK
ncbi:MAG: hypothetical protein ACPH54_07135 [Candidatus Poseidoniaceae archaeon]